MTNFNRPLFCKTTHRSVVRFGITDSGHRKQLNRISPSAEFHQSLSWKQNGRKANLRILGSAAHAAGVPPRRLRHSWHPHARCMPHTHGAHVGSHRRTRVAASCCHLLNPQVVQSKLWPKEASEQLLSVRVRST